MFPLATFTPVAPINTGFNPPVAGNVLLNGGTIIPHSAAKPVTDPSPISFWLSSNVITLE